MLTFLNGASISDSHTCKRFLLALGSPFSSTSSAALSPPAARFENSGETYSLFLIGLANYSTNANVCQEKYEKKIKNNYFSFYFPK